MGTHHDLGFEHLVGQALVVVVPQKPQVVDDHVHGTEAAGYHDDEVRHQETKHADGATGCLAGADSGEAGAGDPLSRRLAGDAPPVSE